MYLYKNKHRNHKLHLQITADGDCSREIKMLAPWKKSYDQPRQHIKTQRHYFTNKGLSSQSYGFSRSHVWMWELDYKESRAPKNWCFCTVVLEKTLESPLDCKEIQPVHHKGNQSWLEGLMLKLKLPILWPPDVKNWLTGKHPDAGKDWRWEEKGTAEDEMVGWHRWLNGLEFEYTLGVGDGQGGLACCSPWGRKESDTTERLNWTEEHCQWLNKGICHLPLQRLNPALLQLLIFNTLWGSSGWREALCAPGIWWESSLDGWVFSGTDFMILILVSPHI